jgi:serine/threonine-protein kinase RsbW
MKRAIRHGIRLIEVNTQADTRMTPIISELMQQTAGAFGAPDGDSVRIRNLAEEACRYVIENAFDPDDAGQFRVSLWRRPRWIELVIEDKGLPTHIEENLPFHRNQLALLPLRAYADEVCFHNLGKDGKRLELRCNISADSIEQILARDQDSTASDMNENENVTVRMMTVDDAIETSRCVYRAYGLSYYYDYTYYPVMLAERLESGQMESCIAVTETGRVVGHLAMLFGESDVKVCETAVAVVDPRYRGRRLFEQMKVMVCARAKDLGLFGIYSEAVTAHPYSQKSNLSIGARETGIVLAYFPDRVLFRKIHASETKTRLTAVLFYKRVIPEPTRDVYLPDHHAEMIQAIYHRSELHRVPIMPPDDAFEAVRGGYTRFDVCHKPDVGTALIQVRAYGGDILLVLHDNLNTLRQQGVACVYLDLPLRDPLTALLCKGFEGFGFFFAGLLIEYEDGDILRLQYLNDIAIDPAIIAIASDFGRTLLEYVLNQREVVALNSI